MKYANGIWAAIVKLWTRLFGRHLKATKPKEAKSYKPIETVGGKGHYFEDKGAIEHGFHCRSSQAKRRKMERKTGRR
jgi:hypothetical protein